MNSADVPADGGPEEVSEAELFETVEAQAATIELLRERKEDPEQ